MKTCLLVLLAVGPLTAAAVAQDDVAKEQKQLEGTWKAVSIESNGQPLDPKEVAFHRLEIKGNTLTIIIGDQGGLHTYTLDPKKNPKTIDIGKLKGIYELKGDTLELCYALESTGKRPAEFGTKKGTDTTYGVWKRAKP